MRTKTLSFVLLLMPPLICAQGCIIGGKPDTPRYVCVDGRSLCQSPSGLIWQAKRGCFMSKIPCCAYEATHYAFSSNPARVYYQYKKCKEGYAFHWGEMQTH
ncbi:hypothetical protein [Legionella jordanis]|uniref:Lipoprotein n=1 Tax=Legionella jordanis TaxID=456 RepID=A0A0W0V9G6_9GAMM|nr:hypothetical protein [Legionella jordanis]KTD16738.1 hypothetical protein Ljor_1044 [Legionella jordanis]RMX03734.1 hypothetical protein EAW55_05030 [Legionella jordanis]RMX22204.1 hypothetical protein EAS68_01395 [Legionella jordanis]HAT8712896.1 hypothetical protein [Legionella jordanis]